MSASNEFNSALPSERLNAYLDDQLSPEERAAFEELVQDNEQLLEELKIQTEIKASLKRSFAAPSIPASLLQRISESEAGQKKTPLSLEDTKRKKRLQLVLVATAVALIWGILGWNMLVPPKVNEYQQLALHDIYQQSIEQGFEPDWVCKDDHQFAKTFQTRQGQALLLKSIPDGEMVGLAYLQGLTSETTSMLARVEGKPIIVFIDRVDRDIQPDEPSKLSGLNLFRKELDGLVLYEITPLNEARVIDYFYSIDELPPAAGDSETDLD